MEVIHYPYISILLAVRNEESCILRCLKALDTLAYPKERIEILIGNDDSTDNSEAIIRQYIVDKPQFKLFSIGKSKIGLLAKTNVLEQLAQHAKGTFYFYTDADIAVPSLWITSILSHFKPETGVVIGITRMKSNAGAFSDLQSIEWLFSLGIFRLLSLAGIPITGMGNNMAVRNEAYHAVGGYERIGFSIVEDFALFKAILCKGYGFVQAYQPELMGSSEPVPTYKKLLEQRKRWMIGVMQSPWYLILSLIVSACLIPLLLVLAFYNFSLSVQLAIASYLLITLPVCIVLRILRVKDLWPAALGFWFHFTLNNFMMLLYYFVPGPTIWKGRDYSTTRSI